MNPLPLLALLLSPPAPLFSKGLTPVAPGRPMAEVSATRCARCHGAMHKEWGESRHALAWSNGIFQREYQQRPLEWCVHCHAPLAEQGAEIARTRKGGVLAAEGVTCAVCHVRGDRILAASKRARSPHEVELVPDMTGPAFCAGCHQFSFPRLAEGRVTGFFDVPMQDTVAQFLRGPQRNKPGACRGCHAASPGKHAYRGAHDPAMLGRALRLSACDRAGTLELAVDNVAAGHNVPTGDVHRHVLLRVWRSSAPEGVFEVSFGRKFSPAPDGGKRLVEDTTLPAGGGWSGRVAAAALGGEPGEPINVELRYVYAIDEHEVPRHPVGEPLWTVVTHLRERIFRTCPK